jgi:hypothetical protein
MDTEIQQEIIKRAANILHGIDEGKPFDSFYFRAVASALEGIYEGDQGKVALYLQYARRFHPEIEMQSRDFGHPEY